MDFREKNYPSRNIGSYARFHTRQNCVSRGQIYKTLKKQSGTFVDGARENVEFLLKTQFAGSEEIGNTNPNIGDPATENQTTSKNTSLAGRIFLAGNGLFKMLNPLNHLERIPQGNAGNAVTNELPMK